MDRDQITIVDDAAHHRLLHEQGGLEAELVYREDGDRLILLHTEVPEPLGGRGIAGRLVRSAVERAATSGQTVAPWCPYARRWLEEHPGVAATVAIDWSEPPK